MFLTSTIGVATRPVGRVDVQVDVGVDPQAAFLHVAVGDAEVVQQQFQLGQIGLGLGRRAHVGLADDFQERRAGPVQVDAAVGLAGHFVVHALAGVFFQVGADDADPLGRKLALGIADLQPAVVAQRQVVLADLVALGQVGIVVVLAVPLGEAGDLAVQGQGRLDATARPPGGSSPAACPACRCTPGRSACWAARRTCVLHPQNILLSVSSCTWTSRPMTMV